MREHCGPLLPPADPVLHPPHHRHPAPLPDVHGEGDPGAGLLVPVLSGVETLNGCYSISTLGRHIVIQSELWAQVSNTNEAPLG